MVDFNMKIRLPNQVATTKDDQILLRLLKGEKKA